MSRYEGKTPVAVLYRGKLMRATPLRNTPSQSFAFTVHQVSADERVDLLADVFIGHSREWHQIADVNPERMYWGDLQPGEVIRIPYV